MKSGISEYADLYNKKSYFVTSEFNPSFVMKFIIKLEQNLSVDKVDKSIPDVTVVLNKRLVTLISHGR